MVREHPWLQLRGKQHVCLSRMRSLTQRTALPDQCLHPAEADVRRPRRKAEFDRDGHTLIKSRTAPAPPSLVLLCFAKTACRHLTITKEGTSDRKPLGRRLWPVTSAPTCRGVR